MTEVEKDFKDRLKELVGFLEKSTASYDGGFPGEARRLAAVIQIIVRDDEGSRSLLSAMGVKDKFFFYDESPDYNPKIGLPMSGLAIVTIGKTSHRYVPRLGGSPALRKKATFDIWWNRNVYIDESKNINLSRKAIVLGVANSPVGSANHELAGAFEALTGKKTVDQAEVVNESDSDMIAVMLASVRQIAHELLISLKAQLPELF